MEPFNLQKGQALFADPMLHDTYFKRSVVLLVEHTRKGTIGFIMNKQLDVQLNDLLPEPLPQNMDVFYGGPVANNSIYYIHTKGKLVEDSVEISDGYYWGGSFEVICDLLESKIMLPEDIRFFVGYTGWDTGQLEDEISGQTWVPSRQPIIELFSPKMVRDAWKRKMNALGKNYAVWANFPENPSLN